MRPHDTVLGKDITGTEGLEGEGTAPEGEGVGKDDAKRWCLSRASKSAFRFRKEPC